ncbi:MAG: acetyl-CoA carboxylase biotin carboxyl carrier protein [Alphaproteobacteria bacterium]
MPNTNPNTNNSISDKRTIKELAKIIEENGLTEIEYETETFRVRMAKNPIVSNYISSVPTAPVVAAAPQAITAKTDTSANVAPAANNDYANNPNVVKSPMVGVIYLSPEPGAPSYIKEGDSVSADQTLLLIEAMKTFNPVKANKNGKITKILVGDGMPVEYGEPLLVLE